MQELVIHMMQKEMLSFHRNHLRLGYWMRVYMIGCHRWHDLMMVKYIIGMKRLKIGQKQTRIVAYGRQNNGLDILIIKEEN
ncbi:MAG: hypothetical protein CL464_11120 [Acidimicrobiaceae bacterium]|nr:hypothetical protein [Acidimicrobiaceae bacterium]